MAEPIETLLEENVDRQLERLGWTRKDLAREMKISPSTLSAILKGRHSPTLKMLARMSGALGTSLASLFLLPGLRIVGTKVTVNSLEDHPIEECYRRLGELLPSKRGGAGT